MGQLKKKSGGGCVGGVSSSPKHYQLCWCRLKKDGKNVGKACNTVDKYYSDFKVLQKA